ncbi:MAG TPA: hypothetical protein VN285_11045 [Candidatus Deferrimicrobium sp.]|nr:hypothetical protein [Candidatus Deferrimicrobium sp.]
MKVIILFTLSLALAALIGAGCENAMTPSPDTDGPEGEVAALVNAPCPDFGSGSPSPLVTVGVGDQSLTFWPFTGTNYSGVGQDPINIIFVGKADPLAIRAALLSLDGDRSSLGLPPVPPFNARWDDAIGDVQVGFGEPDGWTGGCVQLACGEYQPMRFHIRLFQVGDWTVGNAHLEILIPGTADHQVISWEVAEQFVIGDFIRSGLLDPVVPMIPTGQINPAPFRSIPAVIYNGLPVELRGLIGDPLGDVADDVPIGTDGSAIILNLAGQVPLQAETREQDFVLEYGQVVPKPFCSSGPADYIYVAGPVHLKQTSRLTGNGNYEMTFLAKGELAVTPVNPFTGEPIGPTMAAIVHEQHCAKIAGNVSSASSMKFQKLGELTDPNGGQYFNHLIIKSDGQNCYQEKIRCGSEFWQAVIGTTRTDDLLTPAATRGLKD